MKRRVVITGLGAVTPLGTGVQKSWEALCAGKSGIDTIARFDAARFKTRIAGEVRDFTPTDFVDRKLARRNDRFILFAMAAARMAVEDSGLKIDAANSARVGVSIGSALGGIETIEENCHLLAQGGADRISPFFVPAFLPNLAAGQVAIQAGARGPNACSVTACASGAHGIGEAMRFIQGGYADAMIAGGAEAGIAPIMLAGLAAAGAMTTSNEFPQKASRPFDKDHNGFVMSEGSGILVLEELECARRRNARIYAEITGYGASCDAHHIVAPSPEGIGAAACMQAALDDAGIKPEMVDYVNAHGTSTVLNDITETQAIKQVFGEHARKLAISSNKSELGHLWGAAGAVEAICTVLTIIHGIIPPTINLEVPDPQCDLDYVPNVARNARVKTAISNSFGFGGNNGSLVIAGFSD